MAQVWFELIKRNNVEFFFLTSFIVQTNLAIDSLQESILFVEVHKNQSVPFHPFVKKKKH